MPKRELRITLVVSVHDSKLQENMSAFLLGFLGISSSFWRLKPLCPLISQSLELAADQTQENFLEGR